MKVRATLVLISALFVTPAFADDDVLNSDRIEIFPFAEIYLENEGELKTSAEDGEMRPVLIVDGTVELPPLQPTVVVARDIERSMARGAGRK